MESIPNNISTINKKTKTINDSRIDTKQKNINKKIIKKTKILPDYFSMDMDDFLKRLDKGNVSNQEINDAFSTVSEEDIDLYLPDNFSMIKRKKILKIISFYKSEKKRMYDLQKIVDDDFIKKPNNISTNKNNNNKNFFDEEKILKIVNFLKNIKPSENPLADTIFNNLNLIEKINDQKKTASSIILNNSLHVDNKWNVIRTNKLNNNNKESNKIDIEKIEKKKEKKKIFITITDIDNSASLRNPIILEKKIKTIYKTDKINEAKILPSGDLRIWFKNESDAINAKKSNTSNLGNKSRLKIDNTPNKIIVIHRLPKELSNKDIQDSLKSSGFNNTIVRSTNPNNNQKIKTAFVSLNTHEEREKIADIGKVRIGISFFPVSRYKRPDYIQCYKCFLIGHIAATCPNKLKCKICAEEHKSENCKNLQKQKCALCLGPHKATYENCPEKKRYIKNKKMSTEKNNLENKNNNKYPWIPQINTNDNPRKKYKYGEKFLEKENKKNNLTLRNLDDKFEALSLKMSKIDELRESVEKMSALLKGLLP